MRLNPYILYERLRKSYPVILYGSPDPRLTLLYPELFRDHTTHLLSGHVYLATVEHLPLRPVIEKHVTLICIGENPRLAYYKEHATLLLIKKKVDFFDVYQTVQSIYQVFCDWESRLLMLLTESADIQELLNCSYPVFGCPLYVLDETFQFVASVRSASGSRHPRSDDAKDILDFHLFLDFLKENELSMDRHGAFQMDFTIGSYLCVNLFTSGDDYIGCLYIELKGRKYVEGENFLAEYLAGIIQRVAQGTPSLLNSEKNTRKEILQQLMNEMPLSQNQKAQLKTFRKAQQHICISIHFQKRALVLPIRYICSSLEKALPGSLVFEQNSSLMGVIPAESLSNDGTPAEALERAISPLLKEMKLCVGLSNPFSDLYLIRTYYYQAESAIENGRLYHPEKLLYSFSEFVLHEMILNSLGGFPIEAYFPSGFENLREHDCAGGVSYLKTLQVFLEENMSYASTARKLYIHRSTLIERMTRIRQELSVDLADSDQRLLLLILLKALSMEKE